MDQTNVAVRNNVTRFFFFLIKKVHQSILNDIYYIRGIQNQLYAQSKLKRKTKLEFLKIAI